MSMDAKPDPMTEESGKLILLPHFEDELQRLGSPVSLEKNQILCKAGDIPDSCYYICRGKIVAYEYTLSGSEHIFSINRPGELILAPSMVVTHPLLLDFKADMPTTLIRIRREDMFQVIAENPEFSTMLIYSLSLRLVSIIEHSRQRSVPWRVCNLLLSMAERFGAEYDGKVLIRKKISQQAMANTLRANRVTIARAIRSLKEQGLVESINGLYCIRDTDKLRQYMDALEATPGHE